MAYLPMTQSSGGQYTETSLWTNGAPTSSFASQTITLSDSMEKYSYIKFRYRNSTSNAIESNIIVSLFDFKKSISTEGNNRVRPAMEAVNTNSFERVTA